MIIYVVIEVNLVSGSHNFVLYADANDANEYVHMYRSDDVFRIVIQRRVCPKGCIT